MTCWRITKAQAPTKSGKIWQVWEGKQRRKVFRTWREAMDYADTEPRAIEVTLPRDCRTIPLPPAFRHERPIELAWYEDSLIVDFTALGTCETIFIHRDEIKPLALALLAHHYKDA